MNYEPPPGMSISQACQEAIALCKKRKRVVYFTFNGTPLLAVKGVKAETLVSQYYKDNNMPYPPPPFHPQTATEALDRWDKGELVFTIEMGGMGPGYEQAIHILVFELIRDHHDKPLPDKDTWPMWGDDTASRINEACCGFSGAQVSCAKQVAARALKMGWEAMLKTVPDDRRIMVSKCWPHL